ncbi:acetyltransferase (GNAT) family protein [Stackebrandtia albiflava]|uniref:Acetyltransferase (GNAT) family protein n=1 Tax=Stackebrandtia albiflava TaxID=406432 RepID=A0A562V0Z3_9ACTN|nr:GNAT family N-acetyltransferase [Stackebrandtia albiflava]TWJ11483.1 acetyltransferase (GNAT) family protein [Stackebrandtia albiflava]
MDIAYRWRAPLTDIQVNTLHAAAFGHRVLPAPTMARLHRHSLGWVSAHDGDSLVGFVNVAWDGRRHAFLLDTCTAPDRQGGGIGTALVAHAVDRSRDAGCEWLHVDYEEHLTGFYLGACGFRPTAAGLIRLT